MSDIILDRRRTDSGFKLFAVDEDKAKERAKNDFSEKFDVDAGNYEPEIRKFM